MRNVFCWIAILMAIALMASGCASLSAGNVTMRNTKAEDTPPARVSTISGVPADQSTYHYKVTVYPGLDENFDPNPKICLAEYNQLVQLDWFCAKEVDQLAGEFQEIATQAIAYGVVDGLMTMIGMKLGFNLEHVGGYFTYGGLAGAGGGAVNGWITYRETLNVAHGYCMTGMLQKAAELEGKLRRITVTPLYVGNAKLPTVSAAPVPTYPKQNKDGGSFLPPPAK